MLKLATAVPAAPTALVLNNGDTATAITVISKFIGQGGTYRLAAAVPVTTLANSFAWELPACVTRVSGLNDSTIASGITTDPWIFVKFTQDATALPGSIYFGVKAVNSVGSSNSSVANAAVVGGYANSAFKLLKLATAVPAVVATLGGSLTVCPNAAIIYTITAPVGANKYEITGPIGSTVSSINGVQGETPNVLITSDLNFTVLCTTAIVTTNNKLTIKSKNNIGDSATTLSKTLTNGICGTARMAYKEVSADEFSVIVYPNPSSDVFNIDVQLSGKGVTEVQVYDMAGRLIENRQVNSNSFEICRNYASGIYNVIVTQDANLKSLRVMKK